MANETKYGTKEIDADEFAPENSFVNVVAHNALLTRLRSSEARVRELEGVLKQIIAAHEGSSEGAEVCCHMALLASNALEEKTK